MLSVNPFTNFANDLKSEVGSIEQTVDSTFGTLKSIPFVGQNLGGLSEVQTFLDSAGNKIQSVLTSVAGAGLQASDLSHWIYQAVGTPGLGILGGANGSATGTQNDVHIATTGPNAFTLDSNGLLTKAEVEFRIHFAPVAISEPLKLDLGLPSLPFTLKSTGGIYVNVGFDYELAVVFNSNTITLDSSKKLNDFSPSLSSNQLVFGVSAGFTGSPSLQASVGILYGTLTPTPNQQNSLSAQIAVNNITLSGAPTVTLMGGGASGAHIHLTANLGLGSGGASGEFPSISTTVSLDWNDLTSPSSLVFAFGDVSLDLGSFVSNLVEPIVQKIQQYTEPIQGALNFLNQPIPGIDDIPGLSTFSLMTALHLVAGQTGYGPLETVFADVTHIISLINNLGGGLNGLSLDFGSFAMDPNKILSAQAANGAQALLSGVNGIVSYLDTGDLSGSIQDIASSFAGGLASKIASLVPAGPAQDLLNTVAQGVTGMGGGGASVTLDFPLFDNPASIINLLFGKDVDLIKFSAGANLSFPPVDTGVSYFGAEVGTKSSLSVNAAMTVGYDTYGLRKLLQDIENNHNGNDLSDILDGFYIGGPTSGENSYINASGNFDLYVGIGVSIGPISGHLDFQGGLDGTTHLSLNDAAPDSTGDGKIRIPEIETEVGSHQNVFVATGSVTASLKIVISGSVGPFSASDVLSTLASTTLWDSSAAGNAALGLSVAPPVITGVDPNFGLMQGGTTVTIYGSNLENAMQVNFIGTAAHGTIVPDSDTPDSIQVVTPPGNSTASYNSLIQVETPGGQANDMSASDQFYYIAAPTVTSISPQTGPGGGSEIVEIQGTNLDHVTAVNFGPYLGAIDHDSRYLSLDSSTVLYVLSAQDPSTTAEIVNVTVTTPGGTPAIPTDPRDDSDNFLYIPPPNIESIDPNYGPTIANHGEEDVTLRGTNLQGLSSIALGTVSVIPDYISVSSDGKSARLAFGPTQTTAGTVNFTVTTPGGTSNPAGTYYSTNFHLLEHDQSQFTYFTVPVVTSVSPTSGPLNSQNFFGNGPYEATITGTGLGPAANATVFFGANQATIVSDTPPTGSSQNWQMVVQVPPGTAGTVDVTVTTPGGTSAKTRPADAYMYVPAPTVTNVTGLPGLPASGPLSGGTQVEIAGSNLTGTEGVLFGNTFVGAPNFFVSQVSGSNNYVVFATSPMATTAGPVTIRVVSPGGLSSIANPVPPTDQFTYVPGPAPAAPMPNFGPFEGGNTVTITGSYLGNATLGTATVDFGPGNPGTVVSDSSGQIQVIVPQSSPHVLGAVNVTVTTPDGTSSAGQYTYEVVPPIISSLSVTSAPATNHTPVTITGSNLLGATVYFGGVQGTIQEDLFNQIIVLTPLGMVGPAPVTVKTANGPGSQSMVTSNSLPFTYLTGIIVNGVSPSSGPVGGGTQVVISGTNFVGVLATGVKFGGYPASILSATPTEIVVTSPFLGPGTVDVTVTGTDGTSGISQPADQFSFSYPSPTVTGVSPASGNVVGGTSVTISGTNLESQGTSAVYFGTVHASGYTINSDNSITATAPPSPGYATGPVDVTVQSLGGRSAVTAADQFTYGATPTITYLQYSSGPGGQGFDDTIYGANLENATAVYFGDPDRAGAQIIDDYADHIDVVVPGNSGTQDVRVVTPFGMGTVTSPITPADQFTYVTAPIVTRLAGGSGGPLAGGTLVTIAGYNLSFGVTGVKFGGIPATSFGYDENGLTATSPSGSVGAVDVTVTTSAGTSAISSGDRFTYYGVPTITGISTPYGGASGSQAGGNLVLLSGTGLLGAAIFFGDPSNPSNQAFYYYAPQDNAVWVISPAGTGTVDVTAISPGGASAVTSADHFTYFPPPTISGLTPASGAIEGGTAVTITGDSNLATATGVAFGGYPASFSVNPDGSLTAISPVGNRTDPIDVTVTTPYGVSTDPGAFTYTHIPHIDSLTTPSMPGAVVGGPIAGGTSVTIYGEDLYDAQMDPPLVDFGNTSAASVTVNGDGSITAVSPDPAAGTVDVTVTTDLGTSELSPRDDFVFAAVPSIISVSPATGSIASATQVTITGTGLANASAVDFGTVAGTILSDTDSQIVVNSPYDSVGNVFLGSVDITVTTPGGTSATGAATDQFTYMPAPEVDTVAPNSGSVYGGDTVTITGSGLAGASVLFGANVATIVSNTDNQGADTIVALSPEATGDAAGTVDVTATTTYGSSTDFNAFTYAVPPVVTGIMQSIGPLTGGTQVIITGTNLLGATAVDFGANVSTAVISYYSSTEIQVTVPAGSLGTVDALVVGPGGTSLATPADQYTYVAPPIVTGISPGFGPVSTATQVTISGTNLGGATAVDFNDGNGTDYQGTIVSDSDNQLVVTSPIFGFVDVVDITVTAVGGTSDTSTADQFTFIAPPAVSGVSQSSGFRTGGDQVTITGTNLDNLVAVDFGANAATVLSDSSSQIVCVTPAGSDGTVDVTVTTLGGTSSTISVDQFTYIQPPPLITDVSPTAGANGTQVTISGTDLDNASEVDFGGVAGMIQSDSPTQIVCVAPPGGVGPVDVTVTTSPGGIATATGAFTYNPPLTVTSIATPIGPTAGGTAVYVYGTGLDSATVVKFGAAAGTILFDGGTYLIATSPAHAAGTVDVTVVSVSNGTSAISAADHFTYVAPPTAVADSYSIAAGSTLAVDASGGVLANDTDPQMYAITATLVTDPANGTLSLNSDGSFSYTPNSGYIGPDSFTYLASNPYADSGATTVSIAVTPTQLVWNANIGGDWTDPQWSGTGPTHPDATTDATVDTPVVVQVTSPQAADGLGISGGGAVAVGQGVTLAITHDASVTDGGSLNVDPNGAFTAGSTVTLDSGGSINGGAVAAAGYQFNDGTASANLSGPGGLTKSTDGTVTLSGANTYAGPTVVNGGTLIVVGGALPQGTSLIISGSATDYATVSIAATDAFGNPLAAKNSATSSASDATIGSGRLAALLARRRAAQLAAMPSTSADSATVVATATIAIDASADSTQSPAPAPTVAAAPAASVAIASSAMDEVTHAAATQTVRVTTTINLATLSVADGLTTPSGLPAACFAQAIGSSDQPTSVASIGVRAALANVLDEVLQSLSRPASAADLSWLGESLQSEDPWGAADITNRSDLVAPALDALFADNGW